MRKKKKQLSIRQNAQIHSKGCIKPDRQEVPTKMYTLKEMFHDTGNFTLTFLAVSSSASLSIPIINKNKTKQKK